MSAFLAKIPQSKYFVNMIGIIDYKAGNLTSVKRALDHIGIPSMVSSDPAVIAGCDRIIFPGVGTPDRPLRR